MLHHFTRIKFHSSKIKIIIPTLRTFLRLYYILPRTSLHIQISFGHLLLREECVFIPFLKESYTDRTLNLNGDKNNNACRVSII